MGTFWLFTLRTSIRSQQRRLVVHLRHLWCRLVPSGAVPERSKGAGRNPAGYRLRRFESFRPHSLRNPLYPLDRAV
jgi:hypothetical protein